MRAIFVVLGIVVFLFSSFSKDTFMCYIIKSRNCIQVPSILRLISQECNTFSLSSMGDEWIISHVSKNLEFQWRQFYFLRDFHFKKWYLKFPFRDCLLNIRIYLIVSMRFPFNLFTTTGYVWICCWRRCGWRAVFETGFSATKELLTEIYMIF